MLGAGLACSVAGLLLGGRRVHRTRYRPDPWALAEWATARSGIAAATAMIVVSSHNPGVVNPSIFPPAWPALPLLPAVAILVGLAPAVLTPPPPTSVPASRADGERRARSTPAIDVREPAGAERPRVGPRIDPPIGPKIETRA